MAKNNDEKAPIIIIKRVKKVAGGHHGGAWKVAYADFVTAMMAFFLLLWLLNVTTDEQKSMISSYFAPADPRVAETTSGAGGVMGGTTMSPEGAMTSELAPVVSENDEPVPSVGKDAFAEDERASPAAELDRQDEAAFQATEEKIREKLQSVPELKELSQNLLIDMTPEGLRIQIIDQDGRPMFPSGSAQPLPPAVRLLQLVGTSVRELPNQLSIRGHTDSVPYGGSATYTNWELSADRANASRRVLLAGDAMGRLRPERIENVQGKADREPLNLADPKAPNNRRISIILLKQSLVASNKKPARKPMVRPAAPEPRKQEEGIIYFP